MKLLISGILITVCGCTTICGEFDSYKSPVAGKIGKSWPGGDPSLLPKTLFSPEKLTEIRKEMKADPAKLKKIRANADRFLKYTSNDWKKLIPDRSPAPISTETEPGSSGYISDKKCIVCGANNGMPYDYNFVRDPFSMKCRYSGKVFHELPEQQTEAEKKELKGEDQFKHFDGKTRSVKYAYSLKFKTPKGKPVKYYPANMILKYRLSYIIGTWGGGVLPNLTDAYVSTGDEKYAKAIIMILTRLAEVFPHYPLAWHNGIDPRSREEFLKLAENHIAPGSHGWLGPARLNAAAANFRPPMEGYYFFNICKAYMAVANSPSWGDKKNQQFVLKNLIQEGSLLFRAYGAKQCVGNGIGMYAPGLLGMAMVLNDDYFKRGFLKILEDFLYNENWYDGLSTEGSVNYAGMIGGMFNLFKTAGLRDNAGYLKSNPFLLTAGQTRSNLSTLRNAPSQHGDGPNQAFLAGFKKTGKDGKELQQPSAVFGGAGLSILRAGGQGKRMEIIFSHDRYWGHSHDDMLGIQFYYDGIPLMDHFGDSRLGRFIDLRDKFNPLAAKLKKLPYPQPMHPSDMSRKTFSMALPNSVLSKNTVMVDEYGEKSGRAPWLGGFGLPSFTYGNLTLFKGSKPVPNLQIAEAQAENNLALRYQGLREFRRALICVTRPDGTPYAVDIFRVNGGSRHMLLYHSRGKEVTSSLPPVNEKYPDINAWAAKQKRVFQPESVNAVANEKLLRNFQLTKRVPPMWSHTWLLDYAAWDSKNKPSQAAKTIKPVYLTLYGLAGQRNAVETGVRAVTDYPAMIDENIDGQRQRGMVEFKDAVNYVGTLRTNPRRMASTFVHVLEPRLLSASCISDIKKLDLIAPMPGAVGLEITFIDKTKDYVLYLPPDAGKVEFSDPMIVINGRAALIRTNAKRKMVDFALISGNHLQVRSRTFIGQAAADMRGEVIDLIGDISGDRSESAIIVKPFTDWPLGAKLAGRYLTVGFNHGKQTENYQIAGVTKLTDGNLRINLMHSPFFVDIFGEVASLRDNKDPERHPVRSSQFIGTMIQKGGMFMTPYLCGSKVAFPELGLVFPLKTGEFKVDAKNRYDLADDIDLIKAGVKPGMKFAVFPDFKNAKVKVVGAAELIKSKK